MAPKKLSIIFILIHIIAVLYCAELLSSQSNAILYHEDFTNPDPLAYYLAGSADIDETQQNLYLIRNTYWSHSKFFFNTPIYLEKCCFEFDFYIGGGGSLGGADGLTLSLVKSYFFAPTNGGTLNFWAADGFAIEFDTYYNSEYNDTSEEHVAVIYGSSNNHLARYVAANGEIENAQWHHALILFDNGIINVTVDGMPRINYQIANYTADYYYPGFTASTGNGNNNHIIDNIVVYEPQDQSGVKVYVRSLGSETALPEAVVYLYHGSDIVNAAATDEYGFAHITGLVAGEYWLKASYNGHESEPKVVAVPENGNATVDLEVATYMELRASVVDSFNQAFIPGCRVELLSGGVQTGITVNSTREIRPEDGSASYNVMIPVLEPGEYSFRASKSGFMGTYPFKQALYPEKTSSPVTVLSSGNWKSMGTLSLSSKVVVLLHGLASSHETWGDLETGYVHDLLEDGWSVYDGIDLPGELAGTGRFGLNAICDQASYLQKIMNASGVESYGIVAHSQGGLVARYMIEHLQIFEPARVPKIIMLGTPNHGSPLVWEGWDLIRWLISSTGYMSSFLLEHHMTQLMSTVKEDYPAIGDLEPDSHFIRSLNQENASQYDWNGYCRDSLPMVEKHLCRKTEYLTLAGSGTGNLDMIFSNLQLRLKYGCVNDSRVPVSSTKLWADEENIHNYLGTDTDPAHMIYHLPAGPFPESMVESESIREWVIRRLNENPDDWPEATGASQLLSVTTSNEWSRIGSWELEAGLGSAVIDTINVDSCDSLKFTWAWFEGETDMALISPTGTLISSVNWMFQPGVALELNAEGRWGEYTIANPDGGDWRIILSTSPATPIHYIMYWLSSLNGVKMDVVISNSEITTFSDRRLEVAITSPDGSPVSSAAVTASVATPDYVTSELVLLDDGNAPDVYADDGIYTAVLSMVPMAGTTLLHFKAEGAYPEPFLREYDSNITVGKSADIGIIEPGLSVSSPSCRAGDEIELEVSFVNEGLFSCGVEVCFYLGNDAEIVYSDTLTGLVGVPATATASYLPLLSGSYDFRARVRPVANIQEVDWSDNYSDSSIVIGAVNTGTGDWEDGPGTGDRPSDGHGPNARIVKTVPNPFNPVINVYYSMKNAGEVEIAVYNVAGQMVRVLLDSHMEKGMNQVVWDGRNTNGGKAASGVYFVMIKSLGGSETRKIVLLK